MILAYQAIGCCHDIAARKYHAPLCQATAAFAAVVIRALARRVPLQVEEKGVSRSFQAPPRIARAATVGISSRAGQKSAARGQGVRERKFFAGFCNEWTYGADWTYESDHVSPYYGSNRITPMSAISLIRSARTFALYLGEPAPSIAALRALDHLTKPF